MNTKLKRQKEEHSIRRRKFKKSDRGSYRKWKQTESIHIKGCEKLKV